MALLMQAVFSLATGYSQGTPRFGALAALCQACDADPAPDARRNWDCTHADDGTFSSADADDGPCGCAPGVCWGLCYCSAGEPRSDYTDSDGCPPRPHAGTAASAAQSLDDASPNVNG